ncbi:hypothetical protein SLI_6283 [Streptomyces lividans 1326]|uniref:Uncharacterized protein n=1 Tax=Streptomyces lividans 1326 TaxID=1200984 RepID=A0A7U9DYZ0_STRLI|nr:hypothetical protein SLI_6283 [Streptomyces lividans 1326]
MQSGGEDLTQRILAHMSTRIRRALAEDSLVSSESSGES